MKERILTGWNFTRALYVLMGIFIIIQAFMTQQWFGVLLGLYFFSMGFFAFGCAAGNCYSKSINHATTQKNNDLSNNIEFEEVKNI